MNKIVKKNLPVLLTSAAVIVALLVLRQLWVYYMDEPWTRDAHVGADVVQIFESHAGVLPESSDGDALKRYSLGPITRMVQGVRAQVPDAKISVCHGVGGMFAASGTVIFTNEK